MTCESSDLVYAVICSTCNEEYIGKTGEGKTRVQDRVRFYRQDIRQPQYQQLKYEEHLRICGNGEFKIFPFFTLHTNNKHLENNIENIFQINVTLVTATENSN